MGRVSRPYFGPIVWSGGRRVAVPWLRIPATGQRRGRVRHRTSGGNPVWSGAPGKSGGHGRGDIQHHRLGRAVGLRIPANARAVASHRTALWLERGDALLGGEPQRVYNGCDRIRTALENGRLMEWRRVWTRRRPIDDRAGDCALRSAVPRNAQAGFRIALALTLALCMAASVRADSKKLTEDQRIELLRGLTAEYAKIQVVLPRSKTVLEFSSDGTWDKAKWIANSRELGVAG